MSNSSPRRFFRRRTFVAALLGAALLGGVALWNAWVATPDAGKPQALLAKPEPPPEGYVGSAACAECHAEINERYAGHPMGQALAGVLEATPIEDYDAAVFAPGGGPRRYRVEKTGEGVRHHEFVTDESGEVVYDQAVDVAYTLGSGRKGRSYVIDRGGLLFLSPVSWYSEEEKWDLAPGYEPANHPRFDRRATDECLACHSGRLAFERGTRDRYGSPPFVEEAIGCERCHGPGREHIEFHRLKNGTELAAAGATDPIVNPVKLEPDRREAVCYQCHLQGMGRITRYGRTVHDFRPGDRLEDVWTVFVNPNTGDDSRLVTQVEQMRSSECFARSDGRLGCVSCHDPHGLPAAEDRVAFYNDRCLNCHAEQGCALPEPERLASHAAGSCIACHMPRLPTENVPHTSQTDHRIIRRPTSEKPVPAPPAMTVFDGAADRLPRIEVERGLGLVMAPLASSRNDPFLARRADAYLETARAAAPDDVEVLESLATVRALQGRTGEAIDLLREALKLDPDRESALVALAAACSEAGRNEEGVEALGRLFEVNPWHAEFHELHATMLARLGRTDEAIRAAERALELDPSLRDVCLLLADLHRQRGDAERGESYRQQAAKLPVLPRYSVRGLR